MSIYYADIMSTYWAENITDELLAEERSSEACGILFGRHHARLVKLANSNAHTWVRQSGQVEDVVMSVWQNVWGNIASGLFLEDGCWSREYSLKAVLDHKVKCAIREEKIPGIGKRSHELSFQSMEDLIENGRDGEVVELFPQAPFTEWVDTASYDRWWKDKLEEFLSRKPQTRSVAYARLWLIDGLEGEEIASRMGLTAGNLYVIRHRAIKLLASFDAEFGEGSSKAA